MYNPSGYQTVGPIHPMQIQRNLPSIADRKADENNRDRVVVLSMAGDTMCEKNAWNIKPNFNPICFWKIYVQLE